MRNEGDERGIYDFMYGVLCWGFEDTSLFRGVLLIFKHGVSYGVINDTVIFSPPTHLSSFLRCLKMFGLGQPQDVAVLSLPCFPPRRLRSRAGLFFGEDISLLGCSSSEEESPAG